MPEIFPNQNISTSRRIPPEVLRTIFTLYCDQPESYVGVPDEDAVRPPISHNLNSTDTPLILGSVCASWRQVALSTPILWATIVLESPHPHQIPLIRRWLGRAGRNPLTVIMSARGESNLRTSEELDEVISVLVQYSYRWKKIAFWFDDYFPRPLLDIDVSSFLRLESAFLMWDFIPYQLGDIWSILYQSPLIREVYWEYYPPRWHLIPWRQLTSVNCRGFISSEIFWDLLKSCSFLEKLEIGLTQGANDNGPIVPMKPEITHESLQYLVLHFKTSATPFYDSLILPALEKLHVIHDYRLSPHDEAEEALLNMVVRSTCTLRHLKMEGRQLSEGMILELLQQPQLQNIVFLRLTYLTEAILSLLTDTMGAQGHSNSARDFRVLPHLKVIVSDRGYMTYGTALSKMLSARIPFLSDFYVMTLGSLKFVLLDDVADSDRLWYTRGERESGSWHVVESKHFGWPEGGSRLDYQPLSFFWTC